MRLVTISLAKPIVSRIPICACIGYFDGVHRGHQELIRETIAMARQKHCENALITFDPDPAVVIHNLDMAQHITTLRQKISLAYQYGIENIYILKFTPEMCRMPVEEFEQRILLKMNLQGLICGFDYHYGYMGKGSAADLKERMPFPVEVVASVDEEGEKISSTRILRLIRQGDVAAANKLLGHDFEIIGRVVHGRGKGHQLGFPTANINVSPEYVQPRTGVYAGYAIVHNRLYEAMINYGHNPTINYRSDLSLEAHLLDFREDIYGAQIRIRFMQYMRPEQKFQSAGNLRMQLEQDVQNVRLLLNR